MCPFAPTVFSGKEAEDDLISAARYQEDAQDDLELVFELDNTCTTS